MEESERSCWEVQSQEDKSGTSQGSMEGAGWWGSSSVLTSGASDASGKPALCPFTADPEYSAAFLNLLRGRNSQFLQGLVLLAKRVAEGRTHRNYSECSTHNSSANSNKPKGLYKTRLVLWPTLGVRESPYPYPITGSTGNQPWDQLCALCASKVSPEPQRPEVWEDDPGVMWCCCSLLCTEALAKS